MDAPSTSAHKNNSDSEDDYMSEAFTVAVSDVRPGLAKTANERRVMRLENNRQQNVEKMRSIPRRADLEKEMRDVGLAKPVGEESKGFALLQKMGYKPGMSLGVKREGKEEGIKQPIAVDFKTCRTGLGHKTEEEEKQKRRVEMHLKAALAKSKADLFLLGDFRKRKRAATIFKQTVGDLMKSRKACENLDIRIGRTIPAVPQFWPIYEVKDDSKSDESKDGLPGQFKYSNGKEAPEDTRLEELHEDELVDRLEDVTEYLRSTHIYCIWCGCQFESLDDMSNQCPGGTRAAHEANDDD